MLCEIYLFLGFQGFLEGLDAGFDEFLWGFTSASIMVIHVRFCRWRYLAHPYSVVGFVISIILPLTMYVMPYDLTISTLSCHMPGRGTVPLLQRHFMMASKLKARKERSVFIRSLR